LKGNFLMLPASPHSPFAIIATLGPASAALAASLRDAGATAFRLNASHLELQDLERILQRVRKELGDFPIVVDLQGAKMRLGNFQPRPIVTGEKLTFSLDQRPHSIQVPHFELFASLASGDTLSCDDGRIRLRVRSTTETSAEVECLVDGVLRPRKGVNVVEHPVVLRALSSQDQSQVELCGRYSNVHFAFSFMSDGREVKWLRQLCPDRQVVGKIERIEAINNFESIARSVDSIWICRGDMGAQLGLVPMARWVFGVTPTNVPCPVVMAGQVLEHLTQHLEPTRSEVCYLHDLVHRGFAGIVLSDETAIGVAPVEAVKTARSLVSGF
jgi:pyruvate kinase